MNINTEFTGVVYFIEHDILKGHSPTRILIFHGGTEQFTCGNVSSYDPEAGRINFVTPLGTSPGVSVRVSIND